LTGNQFGRTLGIQTAGAATACRRRAADVPSDGTGRIEWPSLEGAYRLEITDANGNVMARNDFSAGWGSAKSDAVELADLISSLPKPVPVADQKSDILFNLPHAAMITAIIADDQIRSIVHVFKPAADAVISFTPAADWGNRVGIWVKADFQGENIVPAMGKAELQARPVATFDRARLTNHRQALRHRLAKVKHVASDTALRMEGEQTIAAQQSWTPPVDKKPIKAAATFCIRGSGTRLRGTRFADGCADAPSFHDRRNCRMARSLTAVARNDCCAGLLPEAVVRGQIDDGLARLAARQQSDGGFPMLPRRKKRPCGHRGGRDDFRARSSAIPGAGFERRRGMAASSHGEYVFDESERPARAYGYAGAGGSRQARCLQPALSSPIPVRTKNCLRGGGGGNFHWLSRAINDGNWRPTGLKQCADRDRYSLGWRLAVSGG